MEQRKSIEEKAREAVEQAEMTCRAAMESTPEAYRGYLMFLERNKNFGSEKNPYWRTLRNPYMGVDGRVQMARDDHREDGHSLTITTRLVKFEQQAVCVAEVISSKLGSAIGHRMIKAKGSGAEATHAIETAETHAVGRALGFLGYGLYGSGIASAEEVEDEQQNGSEEEERPIPDMTRPKGAAWETQRKQNEELRATLDAELQTLEAIYNEGDFDRSYLSIHNNIRRELTAKVTNKRLNELLSSVRDTLSAMEQGRDDLQQAADWAGK